MTILYGETPLVSQWVAGHLPNVDSFGQCEAIGVLSREGALIAGVVYHDYQPTCRNIQLSIASISPMWARRENIVGLLAYPFRQLGVFMAWTATPIENRKALKLTGHIGFGHDVTLAHTFGPKKHAVIRQMRKHEFERMYGNG